MKLIKDMTKKEKGLDSLEKTYNQAIQDAIAAVPEEKVDSLEMDRYRDFNQCRKQILEALEKLKKGGEPHEK